MSMPTHLFGTRINLLGLHPRLNNPLKKCLNKSHPTQCNLRNAKRIPLIDTRRYQVSHIVSSTKLSAYLFVLLRSHIRVGKQDTGWIVNNLLYLSPSSQAHPCSAAPALVPSILPVPLRSLERLQRVRGRASYRRSVCVGLQ